MFGNLGYVGRSTGGGGALLPSLSLNFMSGQLDSRLTFTRASAVASDGQFTDASGSSFNSFGINVPRFTPNGLLLEVNKTNSLLNTNAPVTQTTASLAASSFVLWVIGTGSAAVSAGTAVINAGGTATPGVPYGFNVTTAGTVTVTVTGSLTRFQLEQFPYTTSYIASPGVTSARFADSLTMPIGSWFNPNNGTFVTEAMTGPSTVVSNFNTFCVDDGTGNRNNLYDQFLSAGGVTSSIRVGGANSASHFQNPVVPSSTIVKTAMAYSPAAIWTNSRGLNAVTAVLTLGFPAGMTRLMVACENFLGVVPLNGYLRTFRYYPRTMSASELKAVTT